MSPLLDLDNILSVFAWLFEQGKYVYKDPALSVVTVCHCLREESHPLQQGASRTEHGWVGGCVCGCGGGGVGVGETKQQPPPTTYCSYIKAATLHDSFTVNLLLIEVLTCIMCALSRFYMLKICNIQLAMCHSRRFHCIGHF